MLKPCVPEFSVNILSSRLVPRKNERMKKFMITRYLENYQSTAMLSFLIIIIIKKLLKTENIKAVIPRLSKWHS